LRNATAETNAITGCSGIAAVLLARPRSPTSAESAGARTY
jgi:hypothetical protein